MVGFVTYKSLDRGGENESVKVYRCQKVCRRELGLTPASVNLFSNNTSKIKQKNMDSRCYWRHSNRWLPSSSKWICDSFRVGFYCILLFSIYQHSYVSVPQGTDRYECWYMYQSWRNPDNDDATILNEYVKPLKEKKNDEMRRWTQTFDW